LPLFFHAGTYFRLVAYAFDLRRHDIFALIDAACRLRFRWFFRFAYSVFIVPPFLSPPHCRHDIDYAAALDATPDAAYDTPLRRLISATYFADCYADAFISCHFFYGFHTPFRCFLRHYCYCLRRRFITYVDAAYAAIFYLRRRHANISSPMPPPLLPLPLMPPRL